MESFPILGGVARKRGWCFCRGALITQCTLWIGSFHSLGVALTCCLRYKMITSQNVSSEAQVRLRYIQAKVFAFLTISWFTKSLTWWVISTWERVHFRIYLLSHRLLSHQTWPIDWFIGQGNNFLLSLETFGGPFQFSNLLQLLNNHLYQGSIVSIYWKSE